MRFARGIDGRITALLSNMRVVGRFNPDWTIDADGRFVYNGPLQKFKRAETRNHG